MSLRPWFLTVPRSGINAYGGGRVPGYRMRVVTPVGRKPWGPHAQLVFEIANFLNTDEDIPKIDFHLGISEKRIHITGAKIAKIGRRLQAGKLTLETIDANVPEGAGATYDRGEISVSLLDRVFRGGDRGDARADGQSG